MAASDDKQTKKPRCPDCGGTGLRACEENGTALCDCPVGKRRNAASCWD